MDYKTAFQQMFQSADRAAQEAGHAATIVEQTDTSMWITVQDEEGDIIAEGTVEAAGEFQGRLMAKVSVVDSVCPPQFIEAARGDTFMAILLG